MADEARVERLDPRQPLRPEIGGVFTHAEVKIRAHAHPEEGERRSFACWTWAGLEYDEGFPLAGGGVSTASQPSPWWRSCRKVKLLAERTGARLVFGHDADVLAELRREEFYD